MVMVVVMVMMILVSREFDKLHEEFGIKDN